MINLSTISTSKKIVYFLLVLIFLLFAAGCAKEDEEGKKSVSSADQYTLTYLAGENGIIKGDSSQTVNRGSSGTAVTAVPAEGYHFVNWSDGLNTASRTDSNVKADLTVSADFAINEYTLQYTAGENGTIDGFSLQKVKHGGKASQVTAVPYEHYHFVGWSDGVATENRSDFDIKADLFVEAAFAIDQYTLTYEAGANGSIKGVSSQTVDHGSSGSEIIAVPEEGYHFVSWSDGVKTPTRIDSDIRGYLLVRASFALNQYTLAYIAGENGTIDGISPQTVNHGGEGSPVKAVPEKNYHFVEWSDGLASEKRTDRKVIADLKVTARFGIDQYNLTYTAGENGSIKGVTSQRVDHGGTGSIVKAVPAVGYHFVSWSDGVETANRTDSEVTADITVSPEFAINKYTLNYDAGEHGSIDGISLQTVEHGVSANVVTAVAEKGYHFVKWSDGVTTPQRIDLNITGNISVTALFEINTYTVGGIVSGLVENTEVVLQNILGDDLVINANGHFQFVTELYNNDTYDVTVLTQPTSPNQNCTVTNGSGTIPDDNVTNIEVTCVLITYSIGGSITGLPDGDQIILQNNQTDNLIVRTNGFFTFAEPLDDGSTYNVQIHELPKRQNWNCELANGSGTLSGRDVTDVVIDCYPLAVLKSKAGYRKITLTWNIDDFNEIHNNIVVFNFCRTEEEFPPDSFRHCRDFKGGVVDRKVTSSPFILQELPINTPYWFQLEVLADSGNRRTYSEIVKAIPYGGLNDTGIDWCADNRTNFESDGTRPEKNEACETLAAAFPQQDGVHGRDARARIRKLKKTGSGSAGFDFTKICWSGEPAGEGKCPPNPSPGEAENNWACLRDNVTGLTWEIKSNDGLRSKNNNYTWYYPDEKINGDNTGLENGGKCLESNCDTLAYIKAVNEKGLCGASDWRLPTKSELLSIVDNGKFKPAVDSRYFPNTLNAYYWTSSPYSEQEELAWQVYFLYGEASPNSKTESNHIRLVRGKTVTFGFDNP